jgi:hypothetical protein
MTETRILKGEQRGQPSAVSCPAAGISATTPESAGDQARTFCARYRALQVKHQGGTVLLRTLGFLPGVFFNAENPAKRMKTF